MKRATIRTILLTVMFAGAGSLAHGFLPSGEPQPVVRKTPAGKILPTPPRREPVGECFGSTPDLRKALAQACRLLPKVGLARVSTDGRLVTCLQGQLSTPGKNTDDLAWVLAQGSLFGLTTGDQPPALKVIRGFVSAGTSHQTFGLLHQGRPVFDAWVAVHRGSDGIIGLVQASMPPLETLQESSPKDFSLSREEALRAARLALGVPAAKDLGETEAGFWFDGTRTKPVYRVRLGTWYPPGDWEFLIDAGSGTELRRSNRAVFSDPVPTTTGRGNVYLTHPKSSSLSEQPLPWLTANTLAGLFIDVENEDGMSAHGTNGAFLYPPSNTHFDEVMVYYHLNRIHDFYRAMDFEPADKQIGVVVHYGDQYDNAMYLPWCNAIAFGDGERYLPLSREDSVIYHEYAHAMVDRLHPLRGPDGASMNEGQADYFACSLSDEPNLGEYIVSKLNQPCLRTVANALHYPEDLQHEPHDDGRIWGGFLWDLRARFGAKVSDRLIFRSFAFLPEESTFADGLLGLFQSDRNHFGGQFAQAIAEVAAARGFTTATPGTLDARQLRVLAAFENLHER